MNALATIVEWDLVLEVIWVGLAAGVAVTIAMSFGILGAARFAEARRSGSVPDTIAFGLIAFFGFTLSLAAAAFGVYEMAAK